MSAVLRNPDELWPHERTFADIVSDMSTDHDRHVGSLADIERRFEAWGARIEAPSGLGREAEHG